MLKGIKPVILHPDITSSGIVVDHRGLRFYQRFEVLQAVPEMAANGCTENSWKLFDVIVVVENIKQADALLEWLDQGLADVWECVYNYSSGSQKIDGLEF